MSTEKLEKQPEQIEKLDSDDIFDSEIIYCVTKIIIEPFITCIFDKDKYEKGDDYTVDYLESTETKYLCIAFGDELTVSKMGLSKNITIKKGSHAMGTIFVVENRGGNIILNNPLTNISTMYYDYVDKITDTPVFKKIILISEKDRHNVVSQKNKIYISNTEKISHTNNDIPCIEIERIPVGSWFQTQEVYPKRVIVRGWKKQDECSPHLIIKIDEDILIHKIDESTNIENPPSSINEDVEVVVVHIPTPRPLSHITVPVQSNIFKSLNHEETMCCCFKFLIPIYNWFISKVSKVSGKKITPHLANTEFSSGDNLP